jgi:hypothetical protein
MAVSQIRGSTQIMDATITAAKFVGSLGLATSQLQDGATFIRSGGSVAFGADQSMGGFKLTNVATPVSGTDACNYATAQSLASSATVDHTAGSGFIKYTDFVFNETPSGSVNGSNTAFTLTNSPQNSSLRLYINGQLQEPGAGNDYTITGTAITMLYALATGDKIRAYYHK